MTLTAEGMPTSFPADCPDQLMATLHAVQSTSMKANAKTSSLMELNGAGMRVSSLMLHHDTLQTVYRELAIISRPEAPIGAACLGSGIKSSPKLACRHSVTHAAAWCLAGW
jgi:hypothetical protein